MDDIVSIDKFDSEITDLEIELTSVVTIRREISSELKTSPRNQRAEILSRHREIKETEYSLQIKVTEIQLLKAELMDNKSQVVQLKIKLNKLQSRLAHSDWLVWTRSIWKFKEMESNSKTGKHPAQFSSVVPSRLIQMFSFLNDTVLDPFIGTGTTCLEALRLGRNVIGVDVNPDFIQLSEDRIKNSIDKTTNNYTLLNDDSRNLSKLKNDSIQLIVTHPPYWNCVKISDLETDISNCDNNSYEWFLGELKTIISECYRVLEPNRVASFMIGDVTRKVDGVTRLFPLHSDLINIGKDIGFNLWDIYVVETKMKSSGGMPMMGSYPYPQKLFSQFAHNYIIVFRKPE